MDPHPEPPISCTLVRAAGADVLPLLHRISTASLDGLAPGQARATLFCDFRGRLLHRAVVARTADGASWLLRDDAPGDALIAFLDRSVFREDVVLADRGAGLRVRIVPGGAGLPAGTVREAGGRPATVQVDERLALEVEPGAPLPPGDAEERARIEAGRPRHGHEIVPDFTPFEVGLAHEVHLAKGCYTGQETLQRLITYRSVRRRLAVLDGAGPPPGVPCELARDRVPAGRLTSAAPRADGGWIGLAVIANEAAAAGVPLALEDGRPTSPPRPFPPTRPLGRAVD